MSEDSDSSSSAARRARDEDGSGPVEPGGPLRRLLAAAGLLRGFERVPDAKPWEPEIGKLGKLTVGDVAIPKVDIVAVPQNIAKDALVKVFRDSGLSRLPVYDGTLDSPVGVAHLRDLALKHGFNGGNGKFSLKKLLRKAIYVPASMPTGVLLRRMQSERTHMALVIDEYGGVDGLATFEDLLEQIVGEIEDEHDTPDGPDWFREASGAYLAQATTPLKEFESEIGLSLAQSRGIEEEDAADTLGGLVFMLLGRVPVRGEIAMHGSGVSFEVTNADTRRIKTLRVRLPEPDGE